MPFVIRVNPDRTSGVFGQVMATLDEGVDSPSIIVLGDSTGNDPGEWVDLLGQWFAARYPSLRVVQKVWNDGAQKYDAWSVVQAGAGERYANFIAGSSGTRTMYMSPTTFTAVTGDIDLRVKVSLANWAAGTTQNFLARYGSAGSHAYYLGLNTSNYLMFTWSADGTNDLQYNTTTGLGYDPNTVKWLRVTLDVDDGAGNRVITLYDSDDGVTWNTLRTSTTAGTTAIYDPAAQEYEIGGRGLTGGVPTGKVYEAQIRNGIDGPIVNPQPIDAWLPRAASGQYISATFEGTPTLHVVNGSKAGAGLSYLNDGTRLPLMAQPYQAPLVFLSTSHNDSGTVPVLAASWDAWLTALKARLPAAVFCVLTQNPEISPRDSVSIRGQAQRRRFLINWARRNGLYAIDTYSSFVCDARGVAALTNADGVHPNATGSAVWAAAVAAAFAART